VALRRSFATRVQDADEFARFACCPSGGPPWIREAEDYVRVSVLSHATWVLAFRDDDDALVAVSAFDPRVISIPLNEPVDHLGWHLQVVAVRLDRQRERLSQEVFARTFAAMREIAPERLLVTAHVHREHRASRTAAERAGLELLVPKDDHYWLLLGEVVPAE
jgi:RimJ/RimL family protein N-acetyltransferase